MGGLTSRVSKYGGKAITWVSKMARKKKNRTLIKKGLATGADYLAGKLGELATNEGLKHIRNQARARLAAKSNICIP